MFLATDETWMEPEFFQAWKEQHAADVGDDVRSL